MTQPRRWFQIHLSTTVAVLLIVAIILGLNCRRKGFRKTDDGEWGPVGVMSYGWPWDALTQQAEHVRFARTHEDYDAFFDEPVELIHQEDLKFIAIYPWRWQWVWPGLFFNIACAVVLLASFIRLSESRRAVAMEKWVCQSDRSGR